MARPPAQQRSQTSTLAHSPSAHAARHSGAPRARLWRWTQRLSLAAATALIAGLLVPAQPSTAQTTNVDTFADQNNGAADGTSLRDAIAAAPNGGTILLQEGEYVLTIRGGGNDDNRLGDLDIVGKSITIRGAGIGRTIVRASFGDLASDNDRIFDVRPGAGLTLEDLNVSGGRTVNPGGGIRNEGTLNLTRVEVSGNATNLASIGDTGGGIYNTGTATIRNSTISSNSAKFLGGGVYNTVTGTLTIDLSTVSANTVAELDGGGLANQGNASVSNSTFSGNSANRNGGGIANGNVNAAPATGTLSVINTTITGNTADADATVGGNAGGLHNAVNNGNAVTIKNSIVVGNNDLSSEVGTSTFPDLNAQNANTILGNSTNLIGSLAGIQTGWTTIGRGDDIVTTTISLGPLAANGGPTRTHLPLAGSEAIENATDATCQSSPINSLDQRSRPRPADGDADTITACDIGSVEIQSSVAVFSGTTAIANNGNLNLGTTSRGTPISATLVISNAGDAPLRLIPPITVPSGVSVGSFGSTTVAPGQATSLVVTLNATTQGGIGGQLSFKTNDPSLNNGDFQINLQGQVTQAPASIAVIAGGQQIANGGVYDDFNKTNGGGAIQRTITISNAGDENLQLNTPSITGDFSITGFPSNVSPNGTATFQVNFNRTTTGVTTQTITLVSTNAGVAPFSFTVIGASVPGTGPAQLAVRLGTTLLTGTGTIDVGTAFVDQPLTRTLTIHNYGGGELDINPPVTLSPSGLFSVVEQPDGDLLEAGETTTFTVVLSAPTAGPVSRTASIPNNSATNPFTFTLSGVVGEAPPAVTVFAGGLAIPSGGSLNFGSAPQGFPLTRTLTISNTGGPASLSGLTLPVGYSLAGSFPASVAANGEATFVVQLDASALGAATGNLSFNVANQGSYSIALSGEVTLAPGNIGARFGGASIAAGSSVNFGTAPVNVATKRNFTLTNSGALTLTVSAFSLPAGGFSVDPSVVFPLQIAPGGSATVPVILLGGAEGSVGGLATISSDDPDAGLFQFTLNGTIGKRLFYLPLVAR
jgi:hypothetical protein